MDYAIRIRFLARAYVDAQNVIPDLAAAAALSQQIQNPQLVPQIVGVANPQSPGFQERLGLMSPDFRSQVLIQAESFDYLDMNTEAAGSTDADVEAFTERASRILATCANFFGRVPHRLALVQEGFLPEMTEAELNAVAERFLRLPQSYQNPLPFEWDWKCARRGILRIADRDEPANLVTTAKRMSGTLQAQGQQRTPFDRVRIDVDVNTTNQDTRGRFTAADIEQFFRVIALDQHRRLSAEITRFVRGEGR